MDTKDTTGTIDLQHCKSDALFHVPSCSTVRIIYPMYNTTILLYGDSAESAYFVVLNLMMRKYPTIPIIGDNKLAVGISPLDNNSTWLPIGEASVGF